MPQTIHVTLEDDSQEVYEIEPQDNDGWVYDEVPDWARRENIHALQSTEIHGLEDLFAYDSFTTIEEFGDSDWEKLLGAPELLFSVGMIVQFVPASEEFDYAESRHFLPMRFYENTWDVRTGVITKVFPDHDTLQVVSDEALWYLKCEVFAKRAEQPTFESRAEKRAWDEENLSLNYEQRIYDKERSYLCGVTALGPTDQDILPPEEAFDLRLASYSLLAIEQVVTKALGPGAVPLIRAIGAPLAVLKVLTQPSTASKQDVLAAVGVAIVVILLINYNT